MPSHRPPEGTSRRRQLTLTEEALKIPLERPDLEGAVCGELRGKFLPERTSRAANGAWNAGLDEDRLRPCHPVDLTIHVDAEASSRIDIRSKATVPRRYRKEWPLDDPVPRNRGGIVEPRHRTRAWLRRSRNVARG